MSRSFRYFILWIAACGIFFSACGCEGLARKFRRERKHKQDDQLTRQVVMAPVIYEKRPATSEEIYREGYVYFIAALDEFVDELSGKRWNKKRLLDALSQASNSLSDMRSVLSDEKQKIIDGYLREISELTGAVSGDISSAGVYSVVRKAVRIRRDAQKHMQVKAMRAHINDR